jgi:hypothetical protein
MRVLKNLVLSILHCHNFARPVNYFSTEYTFELCYKNIDSYLLTINVTDFKSLLYFEDGLIIICMKDYFPCTQLLLPLFWNWTLLSYTNTESNMAWKYWKMLNFNIVSTRWHKWLNRLHLASEHMMCINWMLLQIIKVHTCVFNIADTCNARALQMSCLI